MPFGITCRIQDDIKREEINLLFKQHRKVYIWGCGSFGKNVLKVLDGKGLQVQGFIDSNPQMHSTVIDEKWIYSPDILNDKEKGYKIIVASQAGKFSIEEYLISLGYQHLHDYLIYQ
ncbi:MAG: hypothetical protein PWP07_644 [Epulopiscium sp.]|nr:hypothetical protein [Candidatus Epulonipiscium sp.]